MKKILLIGEVDDPIEQRLLSILSKDFITKAYYAVSDSNPIFFVRWISVAKKLNNLLRTFKPDKVLVTVGPLIPAFLVFPLIKFLGLKTEVILLRYDIDHFRQYPNGFLGKIEHFTARKLERFCLIKSDKIIHKGLGSELQYLPFYEKIKDKPRYLFREFLDKELIQNYNPQKKLSAKDKEYHLVYVGGVHFKPTPYGDSVWELISNITSQKIHLHLYILPGLIDKQNMDKMNEESNQNPYFHFETAIAHGKLVKELTKYDFGISLHGWNRNNAKIDYYSITAFGNKYYDYLSAKLPSICFNDVTATIEFIEKYNIGLHFSHDNLKNLKKILIKNKTKYPQLIKNIEKAIPPLLNHKKFLEFIYAKIPPIL